MGEMSSGDEPVMMHQKTMSQENSQSKFLADVAHEFQTPLAILRMNLEAWPRGKTARDQRTRQIMATTIERLSRLVNGLLLAAQLNHAEDSLAWRQVNLRTLIAETCEDCLMLAENKGIALSYSNPTLLEEELFTMGDRDRLKEVLLNLLSNAFKHTPAGGTVSVMAKEVGDQGDGNGAMIEIVVADTGSGIARENLSKIFERFYRINDGTVPGIGIGLHLSRQIVEAHDGHISVESELGKGSRFIVRLPLEEKIRAGIRSNLEGGQKAESVI